MNWVLRSIFRFIRISFPFFVLFVYVIINFTVQFTFSLRHLFQVLRSQTIGEGRGH